MVGEQYDRLTRAGHLDGAGGDCVGDNIPTVAMA